MKLGKILIAPAVLLCSGMAAVPASAQSLTNATVSVACQTSQGRVCVHLIGDIGRDNKAVDVVFDLFGGISPGLRNTPVDEVTFQLPAFVSGPGANNHFDEQLCFKPISGPGFDGAGFFVKLVKITNDQGKPADLSITTPNGQPIEVGDFVGSTGPCSVTTPPPSTPSPGTALAPTGGFDSRFPLVGLLLLVAGVALSFIGAGRGRRALRGPR
jgi:hypothetical protein